MSLNNIITLRYEDFRTALELSGDISVIFHGEWSRFAVEEAVQQIRSFNNSAYIFVVYIPHNHGEAIDYVISIGLTAMPALTMFKNSVPNQTIYELSSISSISIRSRLDAPVQRSNVVRAISSQPSALLLFISGDRSSVGKSTFSMFFLAALLDMGFPPSSLGYIKPVTQCEEEQPVSIFCQKNGIACCGVGPIVFYKGFTRAFLSEQTASAAEYLNDAAKAVHEISIGKRIVLVDGVGYPSVGSICGLSNADVAKKLNVPVLLIGRPGVGDAIDSFNMNRSYFEAQGVRVLGNVVNKVSRHGFYSSEAIRPFIHSYFAKYCPHCKLYGLLSEFHYSEGSETPKSITALLTKENVSEFQESVNVSAIVRDVWLHKVFSSQQPSVHNSRATEQIESNVLSKRLHESLGSEPISALFKSEEVLPQEPAYKKIRAEQLRSRAEIESLAALSGAVGG